jgi:hypothetical protein
VGTDSSAELDAPVSKAIRNDYRAQLIAGEQKSQTDYDRTVMALSGGALGVSFAFVEKFLGGQPGAAVVALEVAWAAWVLSLAAVLTSHYLSAVAMRRLLERVDAGEWASLPKRSRLDTGIIVLNALGGAAFIAGAISAGVFVVCNL